MKTETFANLLESAKGLIGVDTLLAAERAAVVRSFTTWIRKGWERARWPELCTTKGFWTDGKVVAVNVTDGGSGYTSTPTVTIAESDTAETATTVAHIAGGVLTGITVTSGADGYSSAPTVTISGGGGTGATAESKLAFTAAHGTSISDVFEVYKTHPYLGSSERVAYILGDDEVVLSSKTEPSVIYIHHRIQIPDYATTDATTTSGSPAAPDGSWTFPARLAPYILRGLYSDWLAAEGQHEKARIILREAEDYILHELDLLEREQKQQAETFFMNHTTQQWRT